MSWKLTKVGVFDDDCYVDVQERYGRQATIIDAIKSLIKFQEYVENKGYIILFDFGIGNGTIFTRLADAIHYALIASYIVDYGEIIRSELCSMDKDDYEMWGGTLTVWYLKPIEKLNGDLNNSKAFIRYEPEEEEWPYSEGEPGEVGIITINGVNYHIRQSREFAVASFGYENDNEE